MANFRRFLALLLLLSVAGLTWAQNTTTNVSYKSNDPNNPFTGEFTKQSDGTWVETNFSGSYYFNEVGRNQNSVYLEDARGRTMTAEINTQRYSILLNGNDFYTITAVVGAAPPDVTINPGPVVDTRTNNTETRNTLTIQEVFVNETSEAGEDEVYLQVWIDGVKQPIAGPKDMNEDDANLERWSPNLVYTFNENFVIGLLEDDGATGDDALGSDNGDTSSGVFSFGAFGDGGDYKVTYSVATETSTQASNICAVPVIDRIDAIKTSNAVDTELLNTLTSFAQEFANLPGQIFSIAGATKLEDTGKAISALSAPIKAIPAIAAAIEESTNWEDDFYVSLSTEGENDVAFWPSSGEDFPLRTGNSTNLLSGSNRMVPYVLGLVSPTDTIDVTFWEWDTLSDDQLGQVRFRLSEADARPRINIVVSPQNGSIYGIAYRVMPIQCPWQAAGGYRSIAQDGNPISKAQKYNNLFQQLLGRSASYEGISSQLASQNVY